MHNSWMSSKVKVSHSKVNGQGIIAVSEMTIGETILIWGGPSYTDKAGALEAIKHDKAVMQWDDDVFSYEIEDEDTDCFLINHSCNPNAWMKGAFKICARRPIAAGEEITADYALWETDQKFVASWTCKCGQHLCRGRITGVDWKKPIIQEQYKGHFSPLLNKRIEQQDI